MRRKNSLSHHLIDVSRSFEKYNPRLKALPGKMQNLVLEAVLSHFPTLKLNPEHILIISRLFDKTILSSDRVEPVALLSEIYEDPHLVIDKLDLVLQLIEARIIDCDNKKYLKVMRKNNEFVLKLDRSVLIDVYIGFTERFMTFVLSSGEREFSADPKPFRHNGEYVKQWFEYVDALMEARSRQRIQDNSESLETDAIAIKKDIDTRLACTKKEFQFQKLAGDYNLSADEQAVLMYVLKQSLEGQTLSGRG